MGIQINGNTNNINAGIGSLSIEDINELDIVGVATAANFKTGVSNLHSVGLTLSGGQIDVGSNIKIGTAGVVTATSFVGSGANLTGIVGGATGVDFNDNIKVRLGTGNDCELYHNGTDTYIANATNNFRIGNTGSTNLKFFTNNSTRWNIDGSGHFVPDTDSQVDIGTNSVRVRNIYADTLYGDGSNLTGIDATADRITEGNSYAEVLDTGTNGIFRFVSEGAERFRVTHDGLFGVGTNNPTYSGLFGGSQEGMVITGSTAPFLRITSSTSSQGDLILQAGNSGADVQMGNLTAGGDIVFWNKPTGGSLTERFRIKEDGHAIIAEGLGVGGQDPGGSTLRVHGSIYASLGGNTSWQKLLLEGSNNTAGDALSINNWGDVEGDYWGLMVNQTMNQSGNYSKTNSGKRTSYITIDGRMGRVYLGGSSTSGNPTDHFYTNWNGSIYADADYGSPRAMYPCRAWANLSGDSSPATIRVSRGIGGFTDLGTGDYRFTFSSAMTDNNYSALCSSAGDAGWSMVPHIYSHNDMTTTTVRFSINAVNVSGQNYDRDIFCMAIFR